MAGAFRDDLEAARSRVDALREENDDLREELEHLRERPVRGSAAAATKPAPPDDPELARLAERTLERLSHLSEEAEAEVLPVGLIPLATPSGPGQEAPARNPRDRVDEHADLEPRYDPLKTQLALLHDQVEVAEREIGELRRQHQRASPWPVVTFAVGVIVGMVVSGMLR